jgi:hypothetical protein
MHEASKWVIGPRLVSFLMEVQVNTGENVANTLLILQEMAAWPQKAKRSARLI